MAEIHPNDIGLATFADVGDVQALRTKAKILVEAVNEVFENGGQTVKMLGTQVYVDGKDNVIIGENNVVNGDNNLIIGNDNVVNGSNYNLIQNRKYLYSFPDISIDYFDASAKKIYYYVYSEEETTIPFAAGDKVAIKVSISWADEEWTDIVSVESPLYVTEIIEVNESGGYVLVADMDISTEPPDDIHTILDYAYVSYFIPLNDACKLNNSSNSIVMGSSATGGNSFSANYGNATGYNSLATNYGNATGSSAAALNYGKAYGTYAFSANNGQSDADSTAAFNYSYNYNPYSLSSGYYSRIYGRPIKLTAINHSAKTLTMESGQNTSGIVGKKIIIRCYNTNNSIIFREATISSVSGTTIYLNDDVYFSTSTNYKETLFPDGLAFIIDKSSSYGSSNFVGGYYCIACGKYSFAHGQYTVAGHDNSVIFGKYGVTDSVNGLYLANGTSTKAPGLAFKALSDGSVHADGEYTSPCADYAEFFEWADGNPNNKDRAGYFVKLSGDKIVKCDEFDIPLGVISAKPAIIGDSGEMHWQGKFVADDFGRVQYHDVVVPAEVDAEGNIIVEEHTENQPILNPDWNAEQEYIPRQNRPEWATVGVLGKLIVYDDGTLKGGDLCRCGKNGTAAKSIKDGYPVLKRVSEDKVLIWVK